MIRPDIVEKCTRMALRGLLAILFVGPPLFAQESPLPPSAASSQNPVPPTIEEFDKPAIGTLKNDRVNLRAGPDLDSDIVGVIDAAGTIFEVHGHSGPWVRIRHADRFGWVYDTYVDVTRVNTPTEANADAGNAADDAAVDIVRDHAVNEQTTEDRHIQFLEAEPIAQASPPPDLPPAALPKSPLAYRPGASRETPASGQDLMAVFTAARGNDPIFMGQRFRHDAAPEIYEQAIAGMLPTVNAQGYYQQSKQEILSTDIAVYGEGVADYPGHGYSLSLTQPVLEYAAIMRIYQAKEEVKRADLQFEAARQDLALRVAEAYLDVLESFENLEFTATKEQALKLHFDLARERYDSGMAPVTDFHDAKARLASVVSERVVAENRLDDAFEALAEVTGQSVAAVSRLSYERPSAELAVRIRAQASAAPHEGADTMQMRNPEPDDVDQWVDAALKQNIQIRIREQDMHVARREIKRQKGGHWPSVALVGKYARDYEGGSLYGGESDVERTDYMVQLNMPLYAGSSVSSRVRDARKQYQAAQQDLEAEIRTVKREIRAAFLGVKSAIANTAALSETVVSYQIALDAKREGYRSGLFPGVVVLDAERDLHMARLDYAIAHYEYIRNSLRLKKAVGTLGEKDLAGINQWLR